MGILFSFRGRINRGQYWLGLLGALGCFLLGSMFAASAMSSTGGGAPILAIPVFLVFMWIYAAVVVKRLRDMGWPLLVQIIYPLLFPAWIIGMMEYIEVATLVYAAVPILLLAFPGVIPDAIAKDKQTT